MNILGVDLSLTGTGLAVMTDSPDFQPRNPKFYESFRSAGQAFTPWFYMGWRVNSPPAGMARWDCILGAVLGCAAVCDLVMIEGYSFGSHSSQARAIAELGGIVRYHLAKIGKPPIEIPPSVLKKFLTGKGNADKNVVLKEVLRRYQLNLDDDNMADAFGLARIGQGLRSHDGLRQDQVAIIEAIKNPKPKVAKRRAA